MMFPTIGADQSVSDFIRSGSYCDTEYSIQDAENLINELVKRNYEGEKKLKLGTQEYTNFDFEMVPLLKIAKHTRDSHECIKIRFTGPKQDSCDGIISINQVEYKVQSVVALDGRQESLQREYLRHDDTPNFVDAMEKPEHEGSKHNRKFPDHELGLAWEIDGPRWQDYHRKIIYDALMKKKNEKYDNYWLSVVVNDSKYFALNENPQSLKPVIDRVLQNNKDLFKIFPKIFFIGIETELFMEYADL